MFPDTPMVQYRAQFLIHIPLSVLDFSSCGKVYRKVCHILICQFSPSETQALGKKRIESKPLLKNLVRALTVDVRMVCQFCQLYIELTLTAFFVPATKPQYPPEYIDNKFRMNKIL